MKRVLLIAGRLALAGVFLWAAIAKLRDPWMILAMDLDSMHILPAAMVEYLARTLPWFELVLGVLLVIGLRLRYVATAATVMLMVFFGVLVVLYMRGFQGDCGCFGPGEQLGPKTLARDFALVLLSAWVTWEAFRGSKRVPVATI